MVREPERLQVPAYYHLRARYACTHWRYGTNPSHNGIASEAIAARFMWRKVGYGEKLLVQTSVDGGRSILKGNFCAVDMIAESGVIFGENNAKDDPLRRPPVFSSVRLLQM